MKAYIHLERWFEELSYLEHSEGMLSWDEAVMMPVGGGEIRAKAVALLHRIVHEKITDPRVAEWLQAAKEDAELDTWQKANLQWMDRIYSNAVCLPSDIVQQLTEARLQSEQAWRLLREKNDWNSFLPFLQKTFHLVKESASLRAHQRNLSIYDLLLDEYSPGVSQALIDPIFSELKNTLPQVIEKILARQRTYAIEPLTGNFSIEKQKALALKLMKVIGFDFNRGRLDVSHHPFCGGDPEDVRITTRYDQENFITALMGVCHETGHGCYEQGLPRQWIRQPVGRIHSMAMHESQSLLIEMQVCRSQEFIQYMVPLIEETFGKHPAFSIKNLYYLYNEVKPSLIRVDADEVTYPLHVILRYELEKQLMNDDISLSDLPEAWNKGMEKYLGISTVGNNKDGVMQDVHWPSGAFGYFPSYTLGSLIAAQLFAAAKKDYPQILSGVESGDFRQLLDWLRQHVHRKASLLNFNDILQETTGAPLKGSYFLNYIHEKYYL